jgi:hypothetical protein
MKGLNMKNKKLFVVVYEEEGETYHNVYTTLKSAIECETDGDKAVEIFEAPLKSLGHYKMISKPQKVALSLKDSE